MRCSQLNVAQPGGTHRSMAGQATDIITKMKDANWTDGDVDYDNDWKMLTLFIGGNDLCRVCEDWVRVLLFDSVKSNLIDIRWSRHIVDSHSMYTM